MVRISKLSYFSMKFGYWQKFQKLHIYPLFTPRGRNWAYFLYQQFPLIFKIAVLGVKLGHWLTKVPDVAHILSFYLKRVGIEFIIALRPAMCKIRADFPNFHIWAWNLVTGKSSRSCTLHTIYPRGSNLSLFSLYGQRFPRYWPIFQTVIF